MVSPLPPPPPSLSAEAPVFRPTFSTHSSSPSTSTSLLFLPNSSNGLHAQGPRRHSDFPSSGLPPVAPSTLAFKTPQLGSAALWDDDDETHSPAPSTSASIGGGGGGRRESLWDSPYSELSEVVMTPPGTPLDERRPSFSLPSLEGNPADALRRYFPEDPTIASMAAKIAELSVQLASSTNQLDVLRAENYSLKTLSPPGGPNMARRGSGLSSSRDERVMEAAFKGIPPPIQTLPGGKLVRPPPEIAQDILLGTMDYRDLFALPGVSFSPVNLPIDVFTLRAQWVVAVLAGEFPAKEGALRRAASALTDILNSEKRFSRRVVSLLNVLATAACALAVRPQGNFLIQSAFGCGREVRQAFFDIMQPEFKTIIPAQYGQHAVLKMIVRDDMRAWFVSQLVELLNDREFLQTRGGTRVLEQAFKSFSRDQCRLVYDKLAEVMNGHWLECALSINGCLVVQNLIELHPHNGDFSHEFLEEVLGGINQVAANSHGSFVLHNLLIHPCLRSQTLLAIFASLDPLCAGPDVGRDAMLEGAKHGCTSEEWGEWVGKVCDGISKVPSLVDAVQRPGGVGLLICALKEAPTLLGDRIRATLLDNSRLLRCTAPGREALNILSGVTSSGGSFGFATRSSSSSYALSPIPSASSFGGGLGGLSLSPSMSSSSSSFNGLSGLGRRSFNSSSLGGSNSNAFEPQARWGMTLGGRR